MPCLQRPLAFASPLVLAALALACEVRVETPPEPDEPGFERYEAPPLTRYEDVDEPPPPPDPWSSDPYPEPPLPVEPVYADLDPELYPALIVIDADTIEGPLASNTDADAPLSFRAQMQWLAGDREPIDFTRAWIESWETVTAVGPAQAPVVPRPAARGLLLDPWSEASSGSAYPSPSVLPSWSAAPFRLIAIVNRVDLARDPCATGGEIRYVYAAIDPVTGSALDMTAILEVPYPGTRPASEWARAWSDLGAIPAGAARAAALERLARDVHVEADPLRARLLTSEIALASEESPGWEMREFHLQIEPIEGAEGQQLTLVQAPLDHTPRADVDAARLSEHVLTHADAIRGSGVQLPEDMQAGAAPLVSPDFRWRVLGVSESLRRAFSLQTCNGCHGGDAEALPFQHITPLSAEGISARVSRFLYDPDAESDELRRRAERLDLLLQSACEPPPGGAAYP
jgi:hypothetical protein